MSLKDISAYLCDVQGTRVGTVAYDCYKFYTASSNSKAYVFICVEKGKHYILCENSLQEHQKERQKKINEVC